MSELFSLVKERFPFYCTLTFPSSCVPSDCLVFADLSSTSSLVGRTDVFIHELERTVTSDVAFYAMDVSIYDVILDTFDAATELCRHMC